MFNRTVNSSIIIVLLSPSVVAVGGDGMFSEILNGVLAREKSNDSCKLKLGLIPAGDNFLS